MKLKRLIKYFTFEEKNRALIELGTDVRLNPNKHWLQLKEGSGGLYPVDDDLYAATWIWNPSTVKQWLGFRADVVHTSVDGVQVTNVKFRLGDGTNQYWWDGGAWSVSTTQWNTEAEIAANISTFPVTEKKLQVVVNLKTTNTTYTPLVKSVKILWSSNISFWEDLVLRSLVPSLRDNLRPISEFLIELSEDADTIDMENDYPLDTPYNIVDIDSVFDQTDDPDLFDDLFQSYDAGTKTITLSSTVTAGHYLRIRFVWEPEVAVNTSQDYTELEKVPMVILSDINLVGVTRRAITDYVVNVADGTAVKVKPPRQGDMEVELVYTTVSLVDHERLAEEVNDYFETNRQLRSVGLDESYDLWLIDEYDATISENREDLNAGRSRFRIRNVLYWAGSEDGYAVQRFVAQGDANFTVE